MLLALMPTRCFSVETSQDSIKEMLEFSFSVNLKCISMLTFLTNLFYLACNFCSIPYCCFSISSKYNYLLYSFAWCICFILYWYDDRRFNRFSCDVLRDWRINSPIILLIMIRCFFVFISLKYIFIPKKCNILIRWI